MSAPVIFKSNVKGMVTFHCRGCGHSHAVYLDEFYPEHDPVPGPRWHFNNDFVKPTRTPSILCLGPVRCHIFVTDGVLHYLDDCEHELRGQAVPMQPRTQAEEAEYA